VDNLLLLFDIGNDAEGIGCGGKGKLSSDSLSSLDINVFSVQR
jgi:hypothetical protein